MSKITLYDYMTEHPEIEEFTVYDKDYDIEIYFYSDILNEDNSWDDNMVMISDCLIVTDSKGDKVWVDLADTIERSIKAEKRKFSKLFCSLDIDDIMDDIESIFAGNVSEEWLTQFAMYLRRGD